MGMFAPYEPHRARGRPPAGLVVRAAGPSDVPALAALRVERGDASTLEADLAFRRLLAAEACLLVAATDGRVVGYGAAQWLTLPGLPAGWYLAGLVVAPAHRRLGIGERLTRARLAWIAARDGREVFYFVNERNRASIDLHARLGFVGARHDVKVPGVAFEGGHGTLFRLALDPTPGGGDP